MYKYRLLALFFIINLFSCDDSPGNKDDESIISILYPTEDSVVNDSVFIDLDLQDLQLYDCAFPIELKNINDTLLVNKNQNFLIGNYAFYAKPRHPFIKSIIDHITNPKITIQDIELGCKHNNDPSQQVFVYYTTGPILVSYTYSNFANKKSITLLQPEPFKDNCFGKYGSHRMYGSWKTNNVKDILT